MGRRWYLVAWDAERHGWRNFRVDRMREPVRTGVRFRQRELPGGDAAEFVRSSLAAAPTRFQVDVVIQAPAAAVRAVVGGWATVEAIDDGSCRMLMNVDSLSWPAMVLGEVGAAFDVTSPPEFRRYLREVGQRFTASAL
jgi:predicted DNA-binding transcriptional regulator YafY